MDTPRSSRELQRGLGRLYDRHFVRCLYRSLVRRKRRRPDVLMGRLDGPPRTLQEFDAKWTVPLWGFESVEHYYQAASTLHALREIDVPTVVLAADDDPLVPAESFQQVEPSPWVRLWLTRGGGHLGFVARASSDPDRWWMDWRVMEWIGSFRGENPSASTTGPRPPRQGAAPAISSR